jgi:large conductance mechanosensitive channel
MWRDFKAFLTKSNALALALGVVIGAAVGKVVAALVDDLIMPIVGLVTPSGDWREMAFGPQSKTSPNGVFRVGHLVGTLVDFLVVAAVIFIVTKLVVREKEKEPPPPRKDCPFCLASIPLAATKCQACTSVVT